jgi:heat shock protein HslJ
MPVREPASAMIAEASTPASAPAEKATAMVAEADLLHRRFTLISLDGEEIVAKNRERQPAIEFLEGMRIAGSGCNRFIAPGKLENGVLVAAAPFAATMMMCMEPELNRLDQVVPAMLEAGARVELAGGALILSGGGHTLVYKASDWVR